MQKRPVVLQPVELSDEALGDLQQFLPAADPVVRDDILEEARPDGRHYVPVCEATFGGQEVRYVSEAMRDGWISSVGPRVKEFERAFAEYCGAKYGVAVTNGTTAIQLALAGLDLRPGDEVILPTFTMVATIATVVHSGATPVLVDVDERHWQPVVQQIEAAITERTRAILVVHLYGHAADMDPIVEMARERNILVIEDAAEAHGATYKGRRCGSLADCATFSFYANKLITTGEGGMVVTDNQELASTMRTLRDHGFSAERHFWHKFVAYNYRMTNLQACVGVAQTEQLPTLLRARQQNALLYRRLVRACGVPGIRFQEKADWAVSAEWMVGVVVDADAYGRTRDELRGELGARGIETRTFFIPMHMQPAYFARFEGQRFPVSERLCRDGFYMPSASCLSPVDIAYVVLALYEACPRVTVRAELADALRRFGRGPSVPPFERSSAYYDTLYASKDTSGEVDFVQTLLQRHGVAGDAALVDLGCGSGRHLVPLAERGYTMLGVDRVGAFLDSVKERAAAAKVGERVHTLCVDGTALDVALDSEAHAAHRGRYDACLSLFDVINYQTTNEALRAFIRGARATLKSGAGHLFVFSSWFGPAVTAQRPNSFRQLRVADIIRHCRTAIRGAENQCDVEYRIWSSALFDDRQRLPGIDDNADGDAATTLAALKADAFVETHTMRYLFLPEVRMLLEQCGFELIEIGEWMSGAPASEETWSVVFVARTTH